MAKHDLTFEPPIMNAAGFLGYSPDMQAAVDWPGMGAFITNPISLAPRTPARGRHFISYPCGFLLHSGYPNPGLRQVLRLHVRQWSRSQVPVIVHLLARRTEEVAHMVRRLESVEGVSGLEVGMASDASHAMVTELTHVASGELPVIMRLPLERSAELAQAAMDAGATAISLAAPRGAYPADGGEMLEGRLYGPSVLPVALKAVQVLVQMGVPTIGAGGIYTRQHVEAMLAAGAIAVQLDSLLWRGVGSNLI